MKLPLSKQYGQLDESNSVLSIESDLLPPQSLDDGTSARDINTHLEPANSSLPKQLDFNELLARDDASNFQSSTPISSDEVLPSCYAKQPSRSVKKMSKKARQVISFTTWRRNPQRAQPSEVPVTTDTKPPPEGAATRPTKKDISRKKLSKSSSPEKVQPLQLLDHDAEGNSGVVGSNGETFQEFIPDISISWSRTPQTVESIQQTKSEEGPDNASIGKSHRRSRTSTRAQGKESVKSTSRERNSRSGRKNKTPPKSTIAMTEELPQSSSVPHSSPSQAPTLDTIDATTGGLDLKSPQKDNTRRSKSKSFTTSNSRSRRRTSSIHENSARSVSPHRSKSSDIPPDAESGATISRLNLSPIAKLPPKDPAHLRVYKTKTSTSERPRSRNRRNKGESKQRAKDIQDTTVVWQREPPSKPPLVSAAGPQGPDRVSRSTLDEVTKRLEHRNNIEKERRETVRKIRGRRYRTSTVVPDGPPTRSASLSRRTVSTIAADLDDVTSAQLGSGRREENFTWQREPPRKSRSSCTPRRTGSLSISGEQVSGTDPSTPKGRRRATRTFSNSNSKGVN